MPPKKSSSSAVKRTAAGEKKEQRFVKNMEQLGAALDATREELDEYYEIIEALDLDEDCSQTLVNIKSETLAKLGLMLDTCSEICVIGQDLHRKKTKSNAEEEGQK